MTSAFVALSSSDLKALAEALRSGRLQPPFFMFALSRYCRADQAAAVADELYRLHVQGAGPELIACTLELLAEDRSRRDQSAVNLELVWTGPEAPGVTNRETSIVVSDLFSRAEHTVHVAGYAVYQGRMVFRSLVERMETRPDLRVRMFLDVSRPYGDTSSSEEIVRRFAWRFQQEEWPGTRLPEVFYDPRALAGEAGTRASLHAKCLVIDRSIALVSSANFTEAAMERNIEAGVLIHSPSFAAHLAGHFDKLVEYGLLARLPFKGETEP